MKPCPDLFTSTIYIIIVSITKFSFVIFSEITDHQYILNLAFHNLHFYTQVTCLI